MHRADATSRVDLDLVSNLYIFRTTSRNVIHPVLCLISMAMETHQASLCMHALDETKNLCKLLGVAGLLYCVICLMYNSMRFQF